MPFCRAKIFCCCCSNSEVSAFTWFRVSSNTTAFSRWPRVCERHTSSLNIFPTHMHIFIRRKKSNNLILKDEFRLGFSIWNLSQKTGHTPFSLPSCHYLTADDAQGLERVILLDYHSMVHATNTVNTFIHWELTVSFRCSGNKSFNWAMHSFIRSRLFFSISLWGSLYVSWIT